MTLPLNGGIGIATTTDGGDPNPGGYFGDILRGTLEQLWKTSRPKIEKEATDFLQQADLVLPGFTLYDVGVQISPDLSYSIDRTAPGDLVITITTGANHVNATSTQPTALGEWADPAISVSFGLTFSYVLDVPPITGPVSATGFRDVRVLDPKAQSENLVADIAFFLGDLLAFFGGPHLVALLERMVTQMDFAPLINDALAPLNAQLDQLAADGFWFLDAVVDQLDGSSGRLHGLSIPGAPADRLDLLLIARALDRSGVVEGEIAWPVSLGRPIIAGLISDSIDLSRSTNAVLVSESALSVKLPTFQAMRVPEGITPPVQADVTSTPAPVLSTPLDAALTQLSTEDRVTAVDELRRGVASRFFDLVGTDVARLALAEFASGRTDFVISATTPVGGTGIIPDMKNVSRMTGLWAADDATTNRRRYRLTDVATGVPLLITAAVAAGLEWQGSTDQVAVVQQGWTGTVTVNKVDPAAKARLADAFAKLRSDHVLIGGAGGIDRVALNPQPLPPREGLLRDGISVSQIVIDDQQAVQLNPQPLPPVERALEVNAVDVSTRFGGRLTDRITQRVEETVDIGRLFERVVENPSGDGVVTGVDFSVQPFVAPVVR